MWQVTPQQVTTPTNVTSKPMRSGGYSILSVAKKVIGHQTVHSTCAPHNQKGRRAKWGGRVIHLVCGRAGVCVEAVGKVPLMSVAPARMRWCGEEWRENPEHWGET